MWAENVEVYRVFCSLVTQWHIVAGFGFVQYTGLRYSAAEVRMRARRVKDRDAMLEDLHVMELAALPILNETKHE